MCFSPNILQLIMTNIVDNFKHPHFQVGARTFPFLFMVPFYDFMHIFQYFESPRALIPHPRSNAPLEGRQVR